MEPERRSSVRAAGRIGAGLVAASVALASSAQAIAAEPGPNRPDWAFGSPWGEVGTAAVCGASMASFFLPQRRSVWGPWSPRESDETYGIISDFTGAFVGTTILMTGTYFLEAGYYGVSGAEAPFSVALRSTLIELEATTLASGIAIGIKRLAGRCRPRAWREGKCGTVDTDYDAFPSGHTTPVAAVAGARFALAINTLGGARGYRYASFALAEGATVFTAVLRVAAGAHSWEDVLGGWIIGHGTGMLLAYLHPMIDANDERPTETSQPLRPMLFTWSGAF
jgi:membrane-associated phospholipid phosphatase